MTGPAPDRAGTRGARIGFWWVLAICCSATCWAAGGHDQPPVAERADNAGFNYFYNNQYDDAIAFFDKQTKAHPNDANEFNHLAQSILYREMYLDGALESQLVTGNNPFLRRRKMEMTAQEKQRFDSCLDRSLQLSGAALEKNPQDTAALSAQGAAHALRANYLFLVEKAWLDALRETSAARKDYQEVLRINPNVVDARLVVGLDEYIVGCLPFYLRAIGSMGGFHGDKAGGIREIETVVQHGVHNHYDAEVLLAVIYRREHCPQKAIPLMEDLAEHFPQNNLFRFEQVQMLSDMGDKAGALKALAEIQRLHDSGASGYANLPPEKIRYVRGNLLFWYGDLDPALSDLEQVTQNADGLDLSTTVLAWLRLGQVYDLKGNHKEAIGAYRHAMEVAPKSEIAEEAKNYIGSPYRRKNKTG